MNGILKLTSAVAVGLLSALLLAGAAQAQPDSSACAAYVGSSAWCEPGVPDYNCDDIPIEYRPIQLINPANDPFRLDADNDSIGCELPGSTSPGQEGANGGDLADDGTLPETGSTALILSGVGAGVLAAGFLLLIAGHRRRNIFVT